MNHVDGLGIQYCHGLYGHLWKSQVRASHLIYHARAHSNGSVALYIASLAEVGHGRVLSRIEVAAIAWGINSLSGLINTVGTKGIGAMSSFNLWWTLGGTLVLVITLLVKAPHKVRPTD